MSVTTNHRRAMAPAEPLALDVVLKASSGRDPDTWPRTRRPLPWLVAGFVAMVWLVPFDSIHANIALPVDTTLDRFALLVLTLVWLASIAIGGSTAPRARHGAVGVAMLLFLGVAVLSVALNIVALAHLGEISLAVKKLSLASSFVLFFYIVVTSLRVSELRAFSTLIVLLAVVTSIGTVYEYRAGHNLFYDYSTRALSGAVSVDAEPPDEKYERPSIVGPTRHGLADATILALALPFALLALLQSRGPRRKLLYAVAVAVIFAGAVATLRKTALIAPLVGVAVLTAYRPRSMLRLLPLGVGVLLAVKILAPGAAPGILFQFSGNAGTASTDDRQTDYAAIVPDVLHHPALGRGFGTFEPSVYRFLDNQYLKLLVEIGFIGLAVYLIAIGAALATAHRAAMSGDPLRAPPALAALAAVASYAVANQLFDAFSFPQPAYGFFFLAALVVVAAIGAREPRVRLARPEGAVPAAPLGSQRMSSYESVSMPTGSSAGLTSAKVEPVSPSIPIASRSSVATPRRLHPQTAAGLTLAVVVSFSDEKRHLQRLLASIASQSRPPHRVLLVNNGSSGGSAEIARAFAADRPHVIGLRPPVRSCLCDDPDPRSFAWAVAKLDEPCDVLVRLDPRVELTRATFEELTGRLETDPRLGIAGPHLSVHGPNGGVRREADPDRQVPAAARFYRRACYEQIAPLPPHLGWDIIDEAHARMLGWRTATVVVTTGDALHLRPRGGMSAARHRGRCAYGCGAHPLHIARTAAACTSRSAPLAGVHFLAGWLLAAATKAPRAEPAVRAQLCREQLTDLRSWLGRGKR